MLQWDDVDNFRASLFRVFPGTGQYGKDEKKQTNKTKHTFLRIEPFIVGGMLTKIGQKLFTH